MNLLYVVESGDYKYLVFDEMPDKISTKYGDDTIIGRIGGIFYDFLAKRNERREAFGGRKFDIVLDNGEIEKCEGQWWDAVTERAREELEKEGNPFSKMMLIGVSSVDRLSDCYVYYGLWASESKIEEMIADYKGRIYEYYEFKEEIINKIRQLYTYWGDFSIADKYGIAGVKDTYKRAFNEWKDDYKFFTELTLVLNHKIWQHYESNRELAALYDRLWREADEYAMNNFKGEELDYYYRVTD